jgi:hypothetical protein
VGRRGCSQERSLDFLRHDGLTKRWPFAAFARNIIVAAPSA